MSWKNNPKIRELEPYARKHGYRYVVLFAVHENGKQYSITTYGTTRGNCDVAKIAGDELHKLVNSETWPNWDIAADAEKGKS